LKGIEAEAFQEIALDLAFVDIQVVRIQAGNTAIAHLIKGTAAGDVPVQVCYLILFIINGLDIEKTLCATATGIHILGAALFLEGKECIEGQPGMHQVYLRG